MFVGVWVCRPLYACVRACARAHTREREKEGEEDTTDFVATHTEVYTESLSQKNTHENLEKRRFTPVCKTKKANYYTTLKHWTCEFFPLR